MDTVEIDSLITLDIDAIARWNVFHRLQELSIPCHCTCGQPLQVSITTAATALQVWSVVRQFTASRDLAVDHLNRCWKEQIAKP